MSRLLLAVGAALFALAAVLLSSCESSASPGDLRASDGGSNLTKRPAAYRPDLFPDIPFERLIGYRLTAEDPQVAVAYAGGALRRLSLSFITRDGDEGKPPRVELDRIVGGLSTLGWRQLASDSKEIERFSKGDEILEVGASTAGSATIISLRLDHPTRATPEQQQ